MASRDEILTAIRNADAAGDSDSVRKLGAYLKTLPADDFPVDGRIMDANDARALRPAAQNGAPASPWSRLEQARQASPVTRFLETGPADAVLGLGQLAAHLVSPLSDKPAQAVDSFIKQRETDIKEARASYGQDTGGIDWPRAAGQFFAQAGAMPARTVGHTLSRVPINSPVMTGAPTLMGRALQGAGMGAGAGATQLVTDPENYAQEKTQQIVLGGALGGLSPFAVEPLMSLAAKGINAARPLFSQAGGQAAGQATASNATTISGAPTLAARGGGSSFGWLGPDPSAGLTPSQKMLVREGKDLGFHFTPGQETGSRALQQMEAKLESQPMTSGPFFSIKEKNQLALNNAAAKAIGLPGATTLDSLTLQRAHDKIVSNLKIGQGSQAQRLDPDTFLNRIADVETEFEGMLPGALADHPLVRRLVNFAANGEANGAQLFELQSRLGKVAMNEMTSANGNRQLGMALYEVQDYVLDQVRDGLSKSGQKAFDTARNQYRTLMLLTGRTNIINPSTGNASGVALANALQTKDRQGFLFGRNNSDLYTAARVAQAFKPIVGDSGTATRSMVTSPMDMLMSMPFNIATRGYLSAPVAAGVRASSAINRGALNDPSVAGLFPLSPVAGLLGVIPAQEK